MRIVKRILTRQEQASEEMRRLGKWDREVRREIARLGYDVDERATIKADGEEPGRVYFTNVGARRLTIVCTVEPETVRILRVTIGRDTFTARQAALWLRKRAAREKRYLP